ncbi:hypothetical protein BDV06DRAFT_170701 [Aspergillus oleicola]
MGSLWEEIRRLSSHTLAPQHQLRDTVFGSLGQLDETEVGQVERLVTQRESSEEAGQEQPEEYLKLEANDIDLDIPHSQLCLPEKGTWYTDDEGKLEKSVEEGWSAVHSARQEVMR